MQKFIYGYDLPFEDGIKVYGTIEAPDYVDASMVFKQCLECKVLADSDVDKATLADFYLRGLRLIFLVKVDDTERTLEAVYPMNPNEKLCIAVEGIREKLFENATEGTTENA